MVEKNENDDFTCILCDKKYKDKSGLWYHNKKYHSTYDKSNDKSDKSNDKSNNKSIEKSIEKSDNNDKKLYECSNCKKKFNHYQSRWKHTKSCNITNHNTRNKQIISTEDFLKMKEEIEELKKKSSKSTINNINKGIINIVMNKSGFETIDILSENEIEYIFKQEMNSIISLLEFINFNEKHPENHTFCTTALNDKYVSTLNTETFQIEKQRKRDFYDHLINQSLIKLKSLTNRLKIIKNKKALDYESKLQKLIDFIVINKKGKKACIELINALSFNKRHITQKTWENLKNGDESILNLLNENIITENSDLLIYKKNKGEKKYTVLDLKHNNVSDTDSDMYSLSDLSDSSSSDDEVIYPKIEYKGKTYLLDDSKLYSIDESGNKNELFGTFLNGKIIKNKPKEFDV